MTNIKYVGRSKPAARSCQVVSPGTTEQPVSLGLNADVRENVREMTESDRIVVMENRKFTNTALPVFSGTEGWYQHIHIVQAIVKSNGWPDETAALQLFVHLRGEALNVALLLTREVRESWTGLVDGLTAYYQSPGRLAGLRRRFKSAVRQPGLDPATFATDLGMLAIQGFSDMKKQARDTMIRYRFIAGQGQCALRRQLDGFAQSTPIGEIVDCCRVWESHSDSNRIPTGNYDSEVGRQSSDSRTGERRSAEVTIERREPVDRSDPLGPQSTYEQPVLLGLVADDRGNAPTDPVGHNAILAGRGEMVDRLDLVGPHNSTEQSVFLGLDVDQVEHVPANIVHPGAEMYCNQPVTDGPAGPDRTSRPVGTDGIHAIYDVDRPMAGGPVGPVFNSQTRWALVGCHP